MAYNKKLHGKARRESERTLQLPNIRRVMSEEIKYSKKVIDFRLELDKFILISKLIANKDIGVRNYWMSILMVRYLNIAIAINRLLPQENKEPSSNHSWDFGSIGILTRSFIEAFHSFFYLGIDEIDDDEWNLRINVFNLHDCTRREKLFRLIGDINTEEKFKKIKHEILDEIKSNKKYLLLNTVLQKKIRKAQTAFLLNRQEIEQRIDIEHDSINWIYLFLSNQTHSFPMSFYRTESEQRGSGVENETDKQYTIYCLDLVEEYLNKGNDYIKNKNIIINNE